MSDWRDISTAPKDGSHLIVSATGWVGEAYFDAEAFNRSEGAWFASGSHWTDAYDGQLFPTHWQPLPLPPPPKSKTVGAHLNRQPSDDLGLPSDSEASS